MSDAHNGVKLIQGTDKNNHVMLLCYWEFIKLSGAYANICSPMIFNATSVIDQHFNGMQDIPNLYSPKGPDILDLLVNDMLLYFAYLFLVILFEFGLSGICRSAGYEFHGFAGFVVLGSWVSGCGVVVVGFVVADEIGDLGAGLSLTTARTPHPSVASWWRTTEKYKGGGASTLVVGNQILHENYPFGKKLKNSHIIGLASKPNNKIDSIDVILTAQDVVVEGFCMRCGSHGSSGRVKRAYVWVGNSATQCPGQCAWPFYQPMYGPQTPPLVSPNGDVGVDGMIINLATLLAGTVTNPFSNGYFQGPPTVPLEAVSACTGIFGAGAYPGYPGTVSVDKVTGASYNANGVNGRKYLLPAMWDPQSSACSTLI
uniref:Protein EXORDIUM-like 2 n=1 Tax=Chenopodium quinoa TaxID=63459 RepID=A0A803LGQ5_CHEQI